MRLQTAARTDAGREREYNEDAVLCTRLDAVDGWLLAVADGMGGHRAGDVASETALATIGDHVGSQIGAGRDARDVLAEGIEAANAEIRSLAADDPALEGMGTTLVAALVTGEVVTIANVGDSRAYLVGDRIDQVTTDQTMVRELVERGAVSESDTDDHPHRHVLSQALGATAIVAPDFYEVDLAGRTLVLCSDGLTAEVSDETICATVRRESPPQTVADWLVERANENGGSDNVSVVIAREP